MKDFDRFIEEAAEKRCPSGQYWCNTDKKCKKIPLGYHVGRRGYLEQDEDENGQNGKSSNGTANNGGNGNGGGGNGSNGGNGGGE